MEEMGAERVSTDAFFSGPANTEPDVRNGRYYLTDPATGNPRSYTRASNMGHVIADQYGLSVWDRRQIVKGIASDPGVIAMLSASVDLDNARVDQVIERARLASASSTGADTGTAIHDVQLRVDRELPVPPDMESWALGYARALEQHGLTPVLREVRVINNRLGVAGRVDAIYRDSTGALVLGDTKSTGRINLAAPEFAVQLACYATADWVELDGVWNRMGPIRQDYAIVLHTDRETGAIALYQVPLALGIYGVGLVEQVRAYRKMSFLAPYVSPASTPGAVEVSYVAAPALPRDGDRRIGPEGTPQVYQLGEWMDEPPAHAKSFADGLQGLVNGVAEVVDRYVSLPSHDSVSRPGGSEADQPPTGPAPDAVLAEQHANEHRPAAEQTPVPPADGPPLRTADDLMRPAVTKAELQEYCRRHGLTDLAHTKKKLVGMLADAGKLAVAGPTGTAPLSLPQDSAEMPAGPATADGEDPSDPHSVAYGRARVAELAACQTVSELAAVWNRVVRAGGERAWTPAMVDMSKKTATRIEASARVDTHRPPTEAPVDLTGNSRMTVEYIAQCKSQKDLADLWSSVTVGGTIPDRWTPEIDEIAKQRLVEIQSAPSDHPDHPVNPFGGQ